MNCKDIILTINGIDNVSNFLFNNRKKNIKIRIYTSTRSYVGKWFDIDRNFLLVEESDMKYRRIKINSINKIKQYINK